MTTDAIAGIFERIAKLIFIRMQAANDNRKVTTEIANATPFYYAEDDHQQYLHKNPYGYCGIGGIGVCLPPGGSQTARGEKTPGDKKNLYRHSSVVRQPFT